MIPGHCIQDGSQHYRLEYMYEAMENQTNLHGDPAHPVSWSHSPASARTEHNGSNEDNTAWPQEQLSGGLHIGGTDDSLVSPEHVDYLPDESYNGFQASYSSQIEALGDPRVPTAAPTTHMYGRDVNMADTGLTQELSGIQVETSSAIAAGTSDIDTSLLAQLNSVTRRAFSRVHPDGTQEYIPSGSHERGSTIPDPLSVEEGGRTWQAYRQDRYYLPNDAVEQDRLDMNHTPFTLTLKGELHKAPVRHPARVLDIGTGTGIWAIDFAERNPASRVIGVDLSLIQPPNIQNRVPNVEFYREDVEDQWVWDEPFDFIHQRLMFSCCNDHKALARKMFEHLRPGGWVEYQDLSLSFESDDGSHLGKAMHKWGYLAMAGAAAKGRDIEVARKYREYLVEAGFVDVVEEKAKLYGNGWPQDPMKKLIGRYGMLSMTEVCQAFAPKVLQDGLGMGVEEVERLTQEVQEEIRDTSIHWYLPLFIVYGRKPYPGEDLSSRPSGQTVGKIEDGIRVGFPASSSSH